MVTMVFTVSKSSLKYLIQSYPPISLFCPKLLQKKYSTTHKYLKYYEILEVSPTSDQETVRQAFLKLVKKYHPDSGSKEADQEKFHVIEAAYRKLQEKFAAERWNKNEGLGEYGLYYEDKKDTKEFDIKHTAPQHRQYLSFDGYGIGTPQQREKQYQKKRAVTAVQNVYNHRISKVPAGSESHLVIKDKTEAKKIKTRSEMERLVEDLIQESMARGDFNNLKGSGKPLPKQNDNPYVDYVTYKMNQVLIDNGFTPEWITLQKEIRNQTKDIRNLLAERRMLFGPEPLSEQEAVQWNGAVKDLQSQVNSLNKKINSFNLQVPLLDKQMVFFQLGREAANILKNGRTKHDVPLRRHRTETNQKEEEFSIIGLLEMLLFKKQ